MNIAEAPVAKKTPKELVMHDDVRVDDYYWMNDREDTEVITHLEKENAYYNAMSAHTKSFQASLFEEMKGRIKEDDSSVPIKIMGIGMLQDMKLARNIPFTADIKNRWMPLKKLSSIATPWPRAMSFLI